MTTCASGADAERMARLLLETRLVACVQVTGITSFYRWDGAVNKDDEQLMLIKAPSLSFDAIEKVIVENHSYKVPEIICIPIGSGSDAYLKWIDGVTVK